MCYIISNEGWGMKKMISVILLIVFLSCAAMSEMRYGKINLLTQGDNQNIIFFDEEKLGLTPIKKKVEVGEHYLRALDEKTLRTTYDAKIEVREGEMTTVIVDRKEVEKSSELQTEVVQLDRPMVNMSNQALMLAQYNSEKKDAATAVLFSLLITGGGQFYNGEVGKGVGFILADVLFYALMIQKQVAYGYYYDTYTYPNAGIGALGFIGIWIWSMADAGFSASDINEKLKVKYGLNVSLRYENPVLQYSLSF
jgi:TM2 domain-containing membrane protein YozV